MEMRCSQAERDADNGECREIAVTAAGATGRYKTLISEQTRRRWHARGDVRRDVLRECALFTGGRGGG